MVAHSICGEGLFSYRLTPVCLSFQGTEEVREKKTTSTSQSCAPVCVKAQWMAESLQTVLNSHLLMAKVSRE